MLYNFEYITLKCFCLAWFVHLNGTFDLSMVYATCSQSGKGMKLYSTSIGQTEAVDGQVSSPVVVTPVRYKDGEGVSRSSTASIIFHLSCVVG